MVKWIAIFSLNSAIRDKISEKTGILKTSATTFFENFEKEKITEERITSSAMLWMASYFTAYFSKTADDIVENNDQVILPRLETGIFWWIDTQDNDYNKKSWQEQVKNFWLCWIEVSLRNGNLSIENLHIERQFRHSFYGQNGREVKAKDC